MNGIYYATNTKNEFPEKGKVKFVAENLDIKDLNFFELTQNQTLNISEIMLDDALFHLIPGIEDENRENSKLKGKAIISDTLLFENISKRLNKEELFHQSQNGDFTKNNQARSERVSSGPHRR